MSVFGMILRLVMIGLIGMAIAAPTGAPAAATYQTLNGPVEARVLRVIDGDTLEVAARIWLEQELTARVRLFGIDAPELRSGCARERALAVQARKITADLAGTEVRLTRIHYDKYGRRVLAMVAAASDGGICPRRCFPPDSRTDIGARAGSTPGASRRDASLQ